jgi:hypothetical protein
MFQYSRRNAPSTSENALQLDGIFRPTDLCKMAKARQSDFIQLDGIFRPTYRAASFHQKSGVSGGVMTAFP